MPTLHRFKFAHLKIATKKFSSDNLLGEGGSAKVYKGWIDRKTYAPSKTGVGIPIAVKRFKKPDNPYTRRQSLVFTLITFILQFSFTHTYIC